jgi:hypothetical protein
LYNGNTCSNNTARHGSGIFRQVSSCFSLISWRFFLAIGALPLRAKSLMRNYVEPISKSGFWFNIQSALSALRPTSKAAANSPALRDFPLD